MWKMRWADSKLAVGLLLLIISRSVDRVYYTRITYDYNEFLWYFSNIICPIAYLVTSWPVVWYKMWFTQEITTEMTSFPHYKFAIMGLFDTLYNLLTAFPTPHIGGNMSNALNQLNLPFNMILSAILLSTRYKRSHYMGAVLVLYGALVTMIPVFRNEVAANMPDPSMFWILFYIIGLLPAAGSNVYKEVGLKDVDLDIWYANAWISTYQILWGALTIWTIQLPAFSDPPVSWQDFPNYISQAHNCFIGNPATFNGKELPCNNGVFVTFMWYILFNCVYNQIMLYVFKEGSSVLFVVSSAVCLPLTDILYMVPFIAGPKASQTFTIYDGFALFVLIMGMLVYHSEKEERVEAATSTQKSPMFSSPSLRQAQLMRGRRKSGRVGGSALALRAPTVKYGTVKDSGNVV
ncbi:hypothetical protein H310_05512 [Aphanomyces invadans]|uniref:EamA domain-containing protein n=1 Tax=Aphanomyces invadans TaxID=157072 RepID=A0A024UA42_9STRA|nr:hypothetical protein H310_05512 [Aphanomyces invadans]ETW03085.1 hypothetical protein H310_05512 [Aphanomyces invadans]|eukprot:XP_008868469.1 hypothetical protein H310_05512 [Aphanomyces invadans]